MLDAQTIIRTDGRAVDELRPVKITRSFTDVPEGSVLIECGNTRVMCTATFTEGVPDATIRDTRVASKDNDGARAIVVIEYERGGKTGSYGFDYQKNEQGEYELKRFGEGVRTDDLH